MDTSRPIINNESLRQLRQPNAMVNDQTGQQQNFQSVQKTTVGGFPAEVDQQGNVSIYHPNGPVYTTTAEIQRQQAQARMQQQIADMPRRKAMAEIQDKEAEAGLKQAELRGGGGKPTFNADLGGYVYPPNEQNPQGRFVPMQGIPQGQSALKSTEDEKKAAGYVVRMETALKQMEGISSKNPDAATPNPFVQMVGGMSDTAKNYIQSVPRQRIESAQEDALDAALTLATGAAYTKEQLKGLRNSYFPMAGDAPETIADKRARFDDVIKTARLRSGRMETGANKVITESRQSSGQPQQQKQPPQIGEIRMGHTYIGGDPASPNSWRK
jgi:hypothetical protein